VSDTADEPDAEPVTEGVAEPGQVRRRNRRIKLTQARSDNWLRNQLADPDGRKWFWGLITALGAFEDRFAASPSGAPDPRATDFYAGQQAAGQRVWRTLAKADPALTALMHAENDGRPAPNLLRN
jgi:hypothetical protein